MVTGHQGIKNVLKEMEAEFPIDSWVIDQFNVWPLIHLCLVKENRERERKVYKATRTEFRKLKSLRFIEYSKIVARDIMCLTDCLKSGNLNIVNKKQKKLSVELLFKTRPNNKRLEIDGRWFDVFLDPFIMWFNNMGFSYLVLEEIENQPLKNSGYYQSVVLDPLVIKLRYFSKFKLKHNVKSNACLIRMDRFEEFLIKLDEYSINRGSIGLENLIKMVVDIKYRTRIYEEILPVHCKAAFITVYATRNNLAFTYACRKRGILTVDVAHGANYHNEASAWVKIPQDGYQCLPNIFWCWTASEANEINKAPNAGTILSHKAIAGGNLFLELSIKDQFEAVTKARKETLQLLSKLGYVKHILISMQPGNDEKIFYKSLLENSPAEWCWWLRLHPRMLNRKSEIIEAFKNKNVIIDQATDRPLYSLLPNMDLHVTSFSSVTIEAARFNVPTILWEKQGGNDYAEYIEKGIARYVPNPDHLLLEIEKFSFNREQDNLIEAGDYLNAFQELIGDIGL